MKLSDALICLISSRHLLVNMSESHVTNTLPDERDKSVHLVINIDIHTYMLISVKYIYFQCDTIQGFNLMKKAMKRGIFVAMFYFGSLAMTVM